MVELWVAIVTDEDYAYGFFNSKELTLAFLRKDFPVAFSQGRYLVKEFCSVEEEV